MTLVLAGFRKLTFRMATWAALLVTVALVGLVFIALGATVQTTRQQAPTESAAAIEDLLRFPGAYEQVLGMILGLGSLVVIIYGAAVAGSEWNWGTLKTAVARGESRSRYIVLGFVPVAVLVAFGLLVTFLVGVGGALVASSIAGIGGNDMGNAATLSSLVEKVARTWFGLAQLAAVGYAVATIARSQLAGVAVAVGAWFGSSIAAIAIPDIVKYLPFEASTYAANLSLTSGTSNGSTLAHTLDPNVALVVVAAWLIGSLGLAAVWTERAEIAG